MDGSGETSRSSHSSSENRVRRVVKSTSQAPTWAIWNAERRAAADLARLSSRSLAVPSADVFFIAAHPRMRPAGRPRTESPSVRSLRQQNLRKKYSIKITIDDDYIDNILNMLTIRLNTSM